jgi:hypothetical protein
VAASALTVCGAQGGVDFLGCGADAGEKLLMKSFGRPDERRRDRERLDGSMNVVPGFSISTVAYPP